MLKLNARRSSCLKRSVLNTNLLTSWCEVQVSFIIIAPDGVHHLYFHEWVSYVNIKTKIQSLFFTFKILKVTQRSEQ